MIRGERSYSSRAALGALSAWNQQQRCDLFRVLKLHARLGANHRYRAFVEYAENSNVSTIRRSEVGDRTPSIRLGGLGH